MSSVNSEPSQEIPIKDSYPRVVIVYHGVVSTQDPRTSHFATLFSGWPREHIAQICTGDGIPLNPLASKIYQLGQSDRRLGRLMHYHRRRAVDQAGTVKQLAGQRGGTVRMRLARWVMRTGLYEIVFKVRISTRLMHFLAEFRPDIVYVSGYSIGQCQIALLVHKLLKKPLCFHPADDWPASLYADSPAWWIMRPLVRRVASVLIRSSTVRIAFTRSMKIEFEHRYGVPFSAVVGPVADFDQCQDAPPISFADASTFTVLYVGSLQGGRWRGALDMAFVVQKLREEGNNIAFVCFSLDTPLAAFEQLGALGVVFHSPVTPEKIPGILKSANVLFLSESFGEESGRAVHSLSSKVPYFIASRRPIVVYGPASTGLARHAKLEGWGHCIEDESRSALLQHLRTLLHAEVEAPRSLEWAQSYDAKFARANLKSLLMDASLSKNA